MRIKSFEFESTQKGWDLKPIAFSDLTLLVGLSGVGKTRILKSLASLVNVSEGKSLPGSRWCIEFNDENDRACVWSGEFERMEDWEELSEEFAMVSEDDEEAKKKARIIKEHLRVDGRNVISRENDLIQLVGEKVPKLSPHESALSLFKEEDEIKPIAKSFQRIVFSDRTEQSGFTRMFAAVNSEKLLKKFSEIESVKQSSHPALTKLFLAYSIKDNIFSEIRSRFIGVFPNVEDVSFGSFNDDDGPAFFNNISFVQLKESGVTQLIPQKDISSGMMRTLSHLAELYLSPSGTIILIDEFENSLGVNCIDAVTEDLLDTSSNIQFIITSHHPYIINNVSSDYWKVVSRSGSSIFAVDAGEIGIGRSSHDAFLQLLNSEQYMRGTSISEALR